MRMPFPSLANGCHLEYRRDTGSPTFRSFLLFVEQIFCISPLIYCFFAKLCFFINHPKVLKFFSYKTFGILTAANSTAYLPVSKPLIIICEDKHYFKVIFSVIFLHRYNCINNINVASRGLTPYWV